MNNLEVYVANIPKQESIVKVIKDNSEDTYVFCAPETIN